MGEKKKGDRGVGRNKVLKLPGKNAWHFKTLTHYQKEGDRPRGSTEGKTTKGEKRGKQSCLLGEKHWGVVLPKTTENKEVR